MAKVEACKCDRCGELFLVNDNPVIKIKVRIDTGNANYSAGYDDYDLCPECEEEMIKALRKETEDPYQKLIKDFEEI